MKTKYNNFFQILLISSALFLMLSCTTDNKPKEQEKAQVEANLEDNTDVASITLPEMNFDIENFSEKEIKNDCPLSTAEVQKLQLEQVDKLPNPADYTDLQYYQLKEIYSGPEGKIILISRTSEMENYAWLISYNSENKLVDSKTVFYDEWAESIRGITSVISNNKIMITEYQLNLATEQESIETKNFYIDGVLKFVAEES